jgi:hypothetical protein
VPNHMLTQRQSQDQEKTLGAEAETSVETGVEAEPGTWKRSSHSRRHREKSNGSTGRSRHRYSDHPTREFAKSRRSESKFREHVPLYLRVQAGERE